MKRDLIVTTILLLISCATILVLIRQVNDLRHDIARLEAMIQSHEDILVPKHLQGSAGPYKNGKSVKQR